MDHPEDSTSSPDWSFPLNQKKGAHMLQTCARHMGSRIVRPHGHLGVSAQEGFVETAVHRHDVASGFREAAGDEEEVGLRLVRWGDG